MGLVSEIWRLFAEMAPFLLFGFAIAGILYVFFPAEKIYSHLAHGRVKSVIKSSLFGVPLPLCSCGVIPVAAHLRNSGANRGATLSFLISTPTTGVDSILATYGLLGPIFAVFRPVAAFITAAVAGITTNFLAPDKTDINTRVNSACNICGSTEPHSHTVAEKVKRAAEYAFGELVEDVAKYLAIGIIAGGVISYLVPDQLVSRYLGNPLLAYPLMILISVPMYVCATGSIPIAASLILKGMPPGAGLAFLIGGPATNTATISFVAGKLGRKTLIIYLLTIAASSVFFSLLLDYLWQKLGGAALPLTTGGTEMLPMWLRNVSAGALLILMIRATFAHHHAHEHHHTEGDEMGKIFRIPDMSCRHCAATITATLKNIDGIDEVKIDLDAKTVEVEGDVPDEKIITAIRQAGYSPETVDN